VTICEVKLKFSRAKGVSICPSLCRLADST